MHRYTALFIAMLLVISFSVTGCSSSKSKDETNQTSTQGAVPKQFESNGVTITLSSDFTESIQNKYTFQYASSNALCIGQKELKSDIAGAGIEVSSLSDYAGIIMRNVGINSGYSEHEESLYFEWDKKINDTYYSYIGFVTETDDSYWLIQFAALKESYSLLRNDFFKYYDSITIGTAEADAE